MKAHQAIPTLKDLLHRDGGAIRAWVKNVRAGELEPPRGFNWLGLAEVAAFNARRDADRVARPLDRFPAEQQRVLRAALCSDQLDSAVTTPELRAWSAAALPALTWADTAVTAYGYLASRSAPKDRHAYQDSAMNLRAYLISRLGVIPENRVLDASEIVDWYFEDLRISPREARDRARAWGEGPPHREDTRQVNTVRQLRRIKNRLAPLALLVESGQLRPAPTLQAWLSLREQLP